MDVYIYAKQITSRTASEPARALDISLVWQEREEYILTARGRPFLNRVIEEVRSQPILGQREAYASLCLG